MSTGIEPRLTGVRGNHACHYTSDAVIQRHFCVNSQTTGPKLTKETYRTDSRKPYWELQIVVAFAAHIIVPCHEYDKTRYSLTFSDRFLSSPISAPTPLGLKRFLSAIMYFVLTELMMSNNLVASLLKGLTVSSTASWSMLVISMPCEIL